MRSQYSRILTGSKSPLGLSLLLSLALLLTPSIAGALDFGGVGIGTHLLVVDGDRGSETAFGGTIRTRFLWILGLELQANSLDSSEAIYGATPYRLGLLIHVVQSEYFHLYLSPGLAGERFADAFNPVGDTTWYRVGGGLEFRIIEGLRVGGDIHWTVPGERVTERYVDDHGEQLLAEYLAGLGSDVAVPSSVSDLTDRYSAGELLDLLPLDRLEFTIGLRYYF